MPKLTEAQQATSWSDYRQEQLRLMLLILWMCPGWRSKGCWCVLLSTQVLPVSHKQEGQALRPLLKTATSSANTCIISSTWPQTLSVMFLVCEGLGTRQYGIVWGSIELEPDLVFCSILTLSWTPYLVHHILYENSSVVEDCLVQWWVVFSAKESWL